MKRALNSSGELVPVTALALLTTRSGQHTVTLVWRSLDGEICQREPLSYTGPDMCSAVDEQLRLRREYGCTASSIMYDGAQS